MQLIGIFFSDPHLLNVRKDRLFFNEFPADLADFSIKLHSQNRTSLSSSHCSYPQTPQGGLKKRIKFQSPPWGI